MWLNKRHLSNPQPRPQPNRLLYNSNRAFSSINHLHFHVIYSDDIGFDDKFPIEK